MLAKTTLTHQLDGKKSLNFAQIDELFLIVSYIVNSRPIGVRILTEDDYHPFTPNNLLLGRAAGYIHKPEEEIAEEKPDLLSAPDRSLSSQEQVCENWWE